MKVLKTEISRIVLKLPCSTVVPISMQYKHLLFSLFLAFFAIHIIILMFSSFTYNFLYPCIRRIVNE